MSRALRPIPLIAALLLSLVVAVPVLAHAELVSSDPADKAVLANPPAVITLAFSEGLDAGKSSFRLDGPAGTVGTGRAAKDGATSMNLDGLALAPGEYAVKWTSAALDGHLDRGTLTFTVKEPTPAPPSPSPIASPTPTSASASPASASPATPPPSPACGVASGPVPTSVAGPSPGADPAPAASSGTDVVVPIIVGLLLVAGVGALVLRRSRRA